LTRNNGNFPFKSLCFENKALPEKSVIKPVFFPIKPGIFPLVEIDTQNFMMFLDLNADLSHFPK
jgi:hypothetical protein